MNEPPVLEYNTTKPPDNFWATVALTLGFLSLLLPLSVLTGLPGIFCGVKGFLRARREGISGATRSILGGTLSAAALVFMVTILVQEYLAARAAAIQVQCMSDMRQVGASLLAYSNDNKGWLPSSLNLIAPYEYPSNPGPQCPLVTPRKAYAGYTYVHQDTPMRSHKAKRPSILPVLYDDSPQRHRGRLNVLFMDGHAEILTPAELKAALASAATQPATIPLPE